MSITLTDGSKLKVKAAVKRMTFEEWKILKEGGELAPPVWQGFISTPEGAEPSFPQVL